MLGRGSQPPILRSPGPSLALHAEVAPVARPGDSRLAELAGSTT